MSKVFIVWVIAFSSVGVAKVFGFSEQAGLFGAILAVGTYLAGELK